MKMRTKTDSNIAVGFLYKKYMMAGLEPPVKGHIKIVLGRFMFGGYYATILY